jgi:rhodanese-related sulfurtransferase
MKEIRPNEVERLVHPNIIDVRETSEVAAGRIPGSVNMPLGLLEFRLQELDKMKGYIIVCRSGARSAKATEFLVSQGFNATNMIGGMMSWKGNVQ